jgi:surface protein
MLFYYCSSLTVLDLSNFNTNNVNDNNIYCMLYGVRENYKIITNEKRILNLIKKI